MTPPSSFLARSQPLIELELDLGAFCADWSHCDQVANYLARAVSYERTNAEDYANLLSTVLNELLEIVFARDDRRGLLVCALYREGPSDRIEFSIPVDESGWNFYREGVALAQSANVRDIYRNCLTAPGGGPQSVVGLLELAADYGAQIALSEVESGQMRLTVHLQLEAGPTA